MTQRNRDILLLGQTLSLKSNPFQNDISKAVDYEKSGAVLIRQGKIAAAGPADSLRAAVHTSDILDYGDKLILPGFVDAHVHYPQTAIIASWGKRLIEWLNHFTFPEEMLFCKADYATDIAETYLDIAISNGTTSLATFTTIHPQSVDAIFEAAVSRGMAIVAGKTCMDRNAPDRLCDTAKSAYDDSKALIEKWHGRERCTYAITPRFSPTSTLDQLSALGLLWSEHPSCLMQTHLSEQIEELQWVTSLFPKARDYLDTYELTGLLGEGSIFGHAIHLTDREKTRINEVGASVVHCPTSNAFIGSGLFDMSTLSESGHRIGLATDIGGGSSFSMLRTMAAAYETGQLNAGPLHPAELLWLATMGSATALRLEKEIGSIEAGKYADLVVIDLNSTPAISQRSAKAKDIWSAVFPTIMMGDDRAVYEVWINGQRVKTVR